MDSQSSSRPTNKNQSSTRRVEQVKPVSNTLDYPHENSPETNSCILTTFPPPEFDNYIIGEQLGQGGTGRVFRARDRKLSRDVAIKFLRGGNVQNDKQAIREAQIAAKLSHPNVVAIYDVDECVIDAQRVPYIVYQHLGGGALNTLTTPQPWYQVRIIGLQLASALAAVHQAGILHCDIKPANAIFVEQDEGGGGIDGILVKLIDFGLSGPSLHDSTGGKQAGTPLYMAPEVQNGKPHTRQSDVWSLGMVLYELCTGSTDVKVKDWPKLHPNVDRGFVTVVNKCLAHNPNERYRSGRELRDALTFFYSPGEQLSMAVHLWISSDRPHHLLWREQQLVNIEPLELDSIPREYQQFIIASRRAVSRVKWIRITLLLLLIVALVGWYAWRDYEERQAERESRQNEKQKEKVLLAKHKPKVVAYHQQLQKLKSSYQGNLERFRESTPEVFDKESYADWIAYLNSADGLANELREHANVLEATRMSTPRSEKLQELLVETIEDQVHLYDIMGKYAEREASINRLELLAKQRYEHWRSPVTVNIIMRPDTPFHLFELHTETRKSNTRRTQNLSYRIGGDLSPGSYVLTIDADLKYAETIYPFVIRPGQSEQTLTLTIDRPPIERVPDGFVYIPKSLYLVGYGQNLAHEPLREFMHSAPLHPRQIGPFLIAKRETTIKEWLAFLEHQCEKMVCPTQFIMGHIPGQPHESAIQRGQDGKWRYIYKEYETGTQLILNADEPLVLKDGDDKSRQSWLNLPFSHITPQSADAYLRWLASRGLLGARLCSEYEWEAAARGVDGRLFPHGNWLNPEDANFDRTYQRNQQLMSPHEVHRHAASRSPFGLFNMSGNVWELVTHVNGNNKVIRGGSYFQDTYTAATANRWVFVDKPGEVIPATGMRVCADLPDFPE